MGGEQEYKKGTERAVEDTEGDMGQAVEDAMDEARRLADKVKGSEQQKKQGKKDEDKRQ